MPFPLAPPPGGAILASGLKYVAAVLAELPAEKNFAVIVQTSQDRIRTGVAWRINDDWALAVEAEHEWRGQTSALATVRWAK
jgi:hypothetical protein